MTSNSFNLLIESFLFLSRQVSRPNPALEWGLLHLGESTSFIWFEFHLSFGQLIDPGHRIPRTFVGRLLAGGHRCSALFCGGGHWIAESVCWSHCGCAFLRSGYPDHQGLLNRSLPCFRRRLRGEHVLCFCGLHFSSASLGQSDPQSCWPHQFYLVAERFRHSGLVA